MRTQYFPKKTFFKKKNSKKALNYLVFRAFLLRNEHFVNFSKKTFIY